MKRFVSILVSLVVLVSVFLLPVSALAADETIYYLTNSYNGSTVKTGFDNGFSDAESIKDGDVHFGWSLGQFTMTSFTKKTDDEGVPVFLVNNGDSIILGYQLQQNIDKLHGKDGVSISYDTNGYDNAFGIEKSKNGFGRGALFVKYTDWTNHTTVTPYFNYLTAVQNGTANVEITSLEEGDYEIALDYEIATPILPGHRYDNYRTTASFKVRNSNCMVYIRENDRGQNELANYSVAENGFKLDYADSHYLSVNVTYEVLTPNGYGLTKTTLFSKEAKDGNVYTDAGIYTITVKNQYTHEEVTTTVSVGDDDITNAYVTSECILTPAEIDEMVASGMARIADDWRIEMIEQPEPEPTAKPIISTIVTAEATTGFGSNMTRIYVPLTCIVVVMVAVVGLIIKLRKNSRKGKPTDSNSEVK